MLKLKTKPVDPLLSLTDVKYHLRIDDTLEDEYLQDLTEAVAGSLDGLHGLLGRALVTQTYELSLGAFPRLISLPMPPLRSVQSVQYVDTNGALQTLAQAEYTVAEAHPAYILPKNSWPQTADLPNSVIVTFEAGYGAPEDVPAPIRRAALERVATAYEHRESSILATAAYREFDGGAADLLTPFREWGF